jgi:hypothetical protein
MPPDTIGGRYEVQREIGRGGMGAVYLCHDRLLGREVAAKQLGGLPGESTPHLARALREARTSAALSHPNVVSIYDAVEENHHVWLVMEYVPSLTLSQLTSKEGPLAPERAAHIGAQLADGLAAAHDRGTVHRDVKPGNVLVGEADHAKISDFGIARSVDDETLTQTGMVTGTPMYFSPQLARGLTATPADDVWALGATLFSAVEGEGPWPQQENSLALLVHIAEHPPPEPRRAGAVAPVIRRMMARDPDDRPSMAEAARQLRDVAGAARADHERTVAMPVPPPVADRAESLSTPRTAAASLAAPPERTAERPAPGEAETRRSRRWVLPLLGVATAVLVVVAASLVAGDLVGGGDDPAAGTADESSADPRSTADDSGSGAADPEAPPTSSPEDTTPTTSATSAVTEADSTSPEQFVTDYYALLPDDTRRAWELLSEEMQSEVGSYGSYQGFWRTVEAVTVDDTAAESEDTVSVDLTYTTSDGTQSETRVITVEDTGDGPQITGDQVA